MRKNGFQIVAFVMAMIAFAFAITQAGCVLACTMCVDCAAGAIAGETGVDVLPPLIRTMMYVITIAAFVQAFFLLLGGILTLQGRMGGPVLLWLAMLGGIISIVGGVLNGIQVGDWSLLWLSITTWIFPLLTAIFATVGVSKFKAQ